MTRLRRARETFDRVLSRPGMTRREGSVVGERLWEVIQMQELEEARLLRSAPRMTAAVVVFEGQVYLAPPGGS